MEDFSRSSVQIMRIFWQQFQGERPRGRKIMVGVGKGGERGAVGVNTKVNTHQGMDPVIQKKKKSNQDPSSRLHGKTFFTN
jgi:hypothetical protein